MTLNTEDILKIQQAVKKSYVINKTGTTGFLDELLANTTPDPISETTVSRQLKYPAAGDDLIGSEGEKFYDGTKDKKTTRSLGTNVAEIIRYPFSISGTVLKNGSDELATETLAALMTIKEKENKDLLNGTYATTPDRQMKGIIPQIPAGQKVSIVKSTFEANPIIEIEGALEKLWRSGTHVFGKGATLAYLSKYLKLNVQSMQNDGVANTVTGYYNTSKGMLKAVADANIATDTLLIGNINAVKKYIYRDLIFKQLAETGDGENYLILQEISNLLLEPNSFMTITFTNA